MVNATCEICSFHPATDQVVIVEKGQRREVPVCSVHRRVAACYPEAKVLIALERCDPESGTPSYKSVPILVSGLRRP
jgi:hypothetical protein